MRQQTGLTLVELMVALLLGLLLSGAMIHVLIASKRSYQMAEALAVMQESAQYASHLLARDIRMAGFLGCSLPDRSPPKIVNHLRSTDPSFTPQNGIEGWEGQSLGTAVTTHPMPLLNAPLQALTSDAWRSSSTSAARIAASAKAVSNSDLLRLWRVDHLSPVSLSQGQLISSLAESAKVGDLVVVSDCMSADILTLCAVNRPSLALDCAANGQVPELAALNTANTEVGRLFGTLYFVAKRQQREANPPALFRRQIKALDHHSQQLKVSNAEELVQGVENLQLHFGEDLSTPPDGAVDRYVTADQVRNWQRVVAVKLGLLMRSERDDLVPEGQTLQFNGHQLSSSDGRLRYALETIITLRNRAL